MSASIAPSPAIKITNLRRPFTEKALRLHLAEYGSYDFFWLSRIKDVCLLQYDSSASAARAQQELNGQVWPEHGAPRLHSSKTINSTLLLLLRYLTHCIPVTSAFSVPHLPPPSSPGLALGVELIDPDEMRAAATADAGPVAAKYAHSAPTLTAATNLPSGTPTLLIHAARSGGRAVTCSSSSSLAEPAHEPSQGRVSTISTLFKSTRALPTIYYQENSRSLAKRARVDEDARLPH